MMLTGANRAPATLLGAAVAGGLLWVAAAYLDRHTTGGYWAVYGIVAGAGLGFGLLQLRGGGGHPPAMFLVAFLPVLVVVGWVLLGMQPHANWFQAHVMRWSRDIGVGDVVHYLGTFLGVLAFGVGFTFATVLEPFTRRRPVVDEPVADRAATDAPTTADRRELELEREHETAVR